jgi:hypothetical protein
VVAPDIYKSTGPDNNLVSAEILLQANRTFIQLDTEAWIDNNFPSFFYTASTCYRDVGLIVDAVAQDLLFEGDSQTTFAGIQYWNHNGYVGEIASELTTTTNTINYISELAQKIVVNDENGTRYQSTVSQVVIVGDPGTSAEAILVADDFTVITDILTTGVEGVTGAIIPNGLAGSTSTSVFNAYTLLQANKEYLKAEAIAFITNTAPGFDYNPETCARDVGYMIDSVSFDLLYGGNRQAIQSGVYYYGYSTTSSAVALELPQVEGAYNYLKYILKYVIEGTELTTKYQTSVAQVTALPTGTSSESSIARSKVERIITIILNGPTGIVKEPISLTASTNNDVANAAAILEANRTFIQAEVAAYVDSEYNGFVNNRSKSYRDVGLVIDAVSQDILLGGNTKSVEAAFSYWTGGYTQLPDHAEVCVSALTHARDVAVQVVENTTVTPEIGNTGTQIINTFFDGGAVAQPAINRNFDLITNAITNGVAFIPESYQGGGLFSATGLSGDDVKIAPKVTGVTDLGGGDFSVTIDKSTVGYAINSTLYFGDTAVFPALNEDVPEQWGSRKVDTLGAMGGMLVDGSVVSSRSPIASMVLNAYTQVAQGGRGIHIINNGYAQLVSIFTIFCNVAVECDSGGIASITNSNSNFGDTCLIAKGYGRREFSGTVYNPAYPTNVPNGEYYPAGY